MALLVLTTGLDIGYIEYLAQYEKVYVFSDFISGYPDMEDLAVAKNLDNVELITELAIDLNEIDKVVTLDCYYGFLIELFKKLNKPVFGAGNEAVLENNRLLQKHLLPQTTPYEVKTLETITVPSVVKVNPYYRGSFETQIFHNKAELEFFKNKLKLEAGIFAEEIEYFQEPIIDKETEIGVDGLSVNGVTFPLLFGIEQSKSTYIAKVIHGWDELYKTPIITNVKALDEIFRQMKYVGFFSTEEIVPKNDWNRSYLIDICMRLALPLGTSYLKFYSNIYDVIRYNQPLKPTAEFVFVIPISSKLADNYFVPAIFTDYEIFEKYISLQTFYKPKKQKTKFLEYYFIKGFSTIGVITLKSNKLPEFDELAETLQRIYKTIEIPDLVDETDTLKENYEHFKQVLEVYGL